MERFEPWRKFKFWYSPFSLNLCIYIQTWSHHITVRHSVREIQHGNMLFAPEFMATNYPRILTLHLSFFDSPHILISSPQILPFTYAQFTVANYFWHHTYLGENSTQTASMLALNLGLWKSICQDSLRMWKLYSAIHRFLGTSSVILQSIYYWCVPKWCESSN